MERTAECITPKHPDKVCDRISDAILTKLLLIDKDTRAAIETMAGHNQVVVMGEITTKASKEEVDSIIQESIKRISGVNNIIINISKQSPEIAQGVDIGGAGDQGIMIGYACDENESMIPQEIYLARSLCKYIYEKHQEDGKTQITLDVNNKIKTIVSSFCNTTSNELKELISNWLKDKQKLDNINIYCNPAGEWNIGGIEANTGLTGRKLICDNYGPQVTIGGGAFSGKDPSKVDRSGAYMARKLAVEILKESKAKEVTVKVAYAIGKKEPVMISVSTKGISESNNFEIKYDSKRFEPQNIVNELGLKNTNYEKVAEWGSFGNGFKWDK